jgi:zinc/manganese transport system substrate-binding protein
MPAHAEGLRVVASFSILGDIAQTIGGSDVSVTTLIAPNSDAHSFSPRPTDARALSQAQLVIVNGMGMEGWMDRLVASSGCKCTIAVASRNVTPLPGGDYHAWQDAANGKRYAANIRDALMTADPVHAKAYHQRAAALIARLDKLDSWIKQEIGRIPPTQRIVMTSHDAFAYYGKAYGVTFIAPSGLSHDSEASASTVASMERQIREQHIRALFLQNISNNRLIEQLARDTGARLGGTLYSDALSTSDGQASSYEAMLRHNTLQLRQALQSTP